jgi:hypothetical protein
MKTAAVFPLLVLLSGAATASAHHAFAAEFDANKPITIEGQLTRVRWANPHGRIWIDAPGEDGKIGSPVALLRRGLRVTDFPPGTTVTVKGFLAKDGTPTINAASVTLPDGRNLYTGSSNRNAQGAGQ